MYGSGCKLPLFILAAGHSQVNSVKILKGFTSGSYILEGTRVWTRKLRGKDCRGGVCAAIWILSQTEHHSWTMQKARIGIPL